MVPVSLFDSVGCWRLFFAQSWKINKNSVSLVKSFKVPFLLFSSICAQFLVGLVLKNENKAFGYLSLLAVLLIPILTFTAFTEI